MSQVSNQHLEEFAARIIADMSEGVVLENAAGYLTFVNAAAARLLGYAPEELVGQHWTLVVPPDQHPIVHAADERRARGEADRYELELLRRDGARLTVIVAASPRYENGAWAGAVVVFTDITERKRAETALRETEISYRDLFNSVTEAIYIQDRAGNFVDVNRGAVEMYGYPREFFIGKSPAVLAAPDKNDLVAVQARVARAFAGEPQQFEFWGKRSNGEIFPKDVRLYPGTYLGQPVVIALATDITERQRAEMALRASEERYRYATQATGQLIYDYDVLNGQINWAGAIEEVTGFTPPEFARVDIREWEKMIHPDDRAHALAELERAQQEHCPYHVEYRFQRKDGAYAWMEDWGIFLSDERGGVYRMIGAMKNISERKQAEATLRHREAILSAIAYAAEQWLQNPDWTNNIHAILARLGQAAEVSRVYIFQNHPAADGTLLMSQRYEWVAPGITPQIDQPTLQNLPYVAAGFARWLNLEQRQPIYGHVRDFPESERAVLEPQDIQSIVVMPIHTGAQWWGFIGFDECRREREWTLAELDALRIAADNLGDAIARSQTEQALRESEDRYRDLVEHSPAIFVLHDLEGNILSVNPAAAELLGYSVAELAQGKVQDHLVPTVRHSFKDYCATVQAHGGARGLMRAQTRTGETRILEYDSNLRTQGVTQPIVRVLARDVTELHRSERQLRQRANEFAALYDIAQDLATTTDLPTLLQTIIAHATALLGAASGAIFLYDAAKQQVELAVTQNFPLQPPVNLTLGEGMAGRVAQTRQPLIVDDYSTWEHRSPKAEGIPFRAALDVPIIFGGELIGVLDISEIGDSARKFTEDDARLLSLFAAQAASAVYNARLLRQAQERATQLALLYDAALTLNRALEPRQAIEHLFHIINQSVSSDRSDFFRYDTNTRTLVFDSGSGYSEHLVPLLHQLQFAEGEARGLVGWVARERMPLYLSDVRNDPRWIPIDPKICSGFWVPVEHEQQFFGVLVVTSTRADAFTPSDQRLITLFANQVAATLERAHLFQAEQRRRTELSALYALARALAETDALETIGAIVTRHAVATLPISFARLALIEDADLVVRAATTSSRVERDAGWGERAHLEDLPCCRAALTQNEPFLLRADDTHPSASERAFVRLDSTHVVCGIPLHAGGQALGILWLGELADPDQLRYAQSLGDHAASAIRRAKWREQTEQRLRQVQALHAIDLAIASSLDANVTMNVFLPQALKQLNVDAACVLRYQPGAQLLTYLAGQGFRGKAIEQTQLRLGKELAGRAALERVVLQATLFEPPSDWQRAFLITDEGFVNCICAPLLAKSELKGVLEVYTRAPFTPTSDWLDLLQALSAQAALALDNAELFSRLQRSHLELSLAYEATLVGWARTVELHDPATRGHAERVAELTVAFARAAGVPETQLQQIRYGALLHNIGKLALPDELWHQRVTPNAVEQDLIRQHPQKAYEILAASASLRALGDIPYCFLENWDGSGYPRGLRGEQIPLAARLFAIADAWDSWLLRATVSPPVAREQARAHLREQSGKRFDPRLVDVFLQTLGAAAPEEPSQ